MASTIKHKKKNKIKLKNICKNCTYHTISMDENYYNAVENYLEKLDTYLDHLDPNRQVTSGEKIIRMKRQERLKKINIKELKNMSEENTNEIKINLKNDDDNFVKKNEQIEDVQENITRYLQTRINLKSDVGMAITENVLNAVNSIALQNQVGSMPQHPAISSENAIELLKNCTDDDLKNFHNFEIDIKGDELVAMKLMGDPIGKVTVEQGAE